VALNLANSRGRKAEELLLHEARARRPKEQVCALPGLNVLGPF